MDYSSGDRIGAYEILSRLGAGAIGIVYRARDDFRRLLIDGTLAMQRADFTGERL